MGKKRSGVQAHTLLLQSYCNSIERFARCKDNQFTLPSNILKSLAKYREHFYCKYLRQANNYKVGCLPSNIVQHWVDTSYLTIQPWEDSSNKSDCRISTTETPSPANFILSSSKEGYTSKSTKRKKDFNENILTATRKKEITDMGEGTIHHDTNNEHIEMSNDKSEYYEKNINNNNIIQKDYCAEEVSMLEDNITKLSHSKKLQSGRDSPVALPHETYNNRSSMFELTSHLHPTLNGSKTKGYKMNKKERIPQWSILSENMNSTFIFSSSRVHERRKIERSSKLKNIFLSSPASRNCRSLFPASIANNTIKKQRATKSTNVQSINTSRHEKEEHDNLTPLKETLNDEQQRKILNNEKEELKTVSPENSSVTTVELNDTIMSRRSLNPVTCLQQQCNIQKISKQNRTKACLRNTNATTRLKGLSESDTQKIENPNKMKAYLRNTNAATRLKGLSESDTQKIENPNKMKAYLRNTNAATRLKGLSESDTQKIENPNKMKAYSRNTNAATHLKRPSESDIQKHKKSNKREMHHRDLHPVASLELSESDIQKHKTVETLTRASTDASIIFLPENIDSDQSTVIMVGCPSRYSINNDSDSTVVDQLLPVVRNGYVNLNLKKKFRIRKQ